MRESRTYGSVRGALSNERPYRDGVLFAAAHMSAALGLTVSPGLLVAADEVIE
jgi:hypothetical protein